MSRDVRQRFQSSVLGLPLLSLRLHQRVNMALDYLQPHGREAFAFADFRLVKIRIPLGYGVHAEVRIQRQVILARKNGEPQNLPLSQRAASRLLAYLPHAELAFVPPPASASRALRGDNLSVDDNPSVPAQVAVPA